MLHDGRMAQGTHNGKTRGSGASVAGSAAGPHRGMTFGGGPRKSSKVEIFTTLVGSLAVAALAVAVCAFAIRGWASEDSRAALATEKATSTALRKELSFVRSELEDFRAALEKAKIELRELQASWDSYVPTCAGPPAANEEHGSDPKQQQQQQQQWSQGRGHIPGESEGLGEAIATPGSDLAEAADGIASPTPGDGCHGRPASGTTGGPSRDA
mmetsp:Transcript_86625/g.181505  ORF Transcript_86625/g.181505 Transcript_86625/m.181505 type:complete len:213 (-) Transcript_86625:343-981(-)